MKPDDKVIINYTDIEDEKFSYFGPAVFLNYVHHDSCWVGSDIEPHCIVMIYEEDADSSAPCCFPVKDVTLAE